MTPTFSTPDIILFNGTIATQDPHRPTAQAVAIAQDRVLAVGSDTDLLPQAGTAAQKIDLNGRLVVPGFIDTHIHFYEWALNRQGIKLDDLVGLEDLLARLQQTADERPAGQWILGQGWNETDWVEPRMPTRDLLDRGAPHHPVLLWRCDLHLAVANSVALKRAGIDAGTPDPADGRIERDTTGEPTGILCELAINRVREAVAAPDPDHILRAFEDGAQALHRRGVTGIHDVRLMADRDGSRAWRAFQRLDREDRLRLHAWVTQPGDRLADITGLGLQTGFGNDRLRVGHVKFFSDGGMGARTAWMIDPFLDAGCGMPLMDMAALAENVRRADDAGLSVMVHAVGDRANRELVDLFEKLESRRLAADRPPAAIPHRIEHVQMIRPEDAQRLGHLNVGLCVTPSNMVLDMNLIDTAVGEKGCWTYDFRRLIDTGAPVMFSSDCPVCDPAPLPAIHAAVTRQRPDGTPADGWYPQNRVSVAEALRDYTATPASFHQAHGLGMIAAGKKADMTVLSENILTVDASRITDTRVDMTVFDGQIVFRQF